MKRRSKTKYTQIHVSIPVRILEDLDATLDFGASRSKLITHLIDIYLKNREDMELSFISNTELLHELKFRFPKDSTQDVMIDSLLKLSE